MVAGLGGVESGKLEVYDRAPLSRIGQPEEAASIWAFLLSDEAKYSKSSRALRNVDLGRFGRPEKSSDLVYSRNMFHSFNCCLKRISADWRTSIVTGSVCTIDRGVLA